jgi:lysophospholipase L1-like esterase
MRGRRFRRWPSRWSGWLLSAVTVLLCLLVGEVVTRIRDPTASLWDYPNYATRMTQPATWEVQFNYDPTLGWEPTPDITGTLMGKHISFTKEGTRVHNLDRPPPTGPLIVAFGDSVTEGYAVGNDETWPANLERQTGRRVLNAGVRGYGLDQIVLRAERMIPKLKPPTVVLAFIADDILRTALMVREAKGKPYFVPEGEGLALRNVPVKTVGRAPLMVAARKVLGYSHLLDWVVGRLRVQQAWYGRQIDNGVDPDLVSCRLMARFAALVKREGAKALVVALPEQAVFTDPPIAARQREMQAAALGCAAKAGLPTLDTFDAFQKENVGRDIDAYYTLLHFTDRAAAIAARAIAASLAANNE